ncbi:TonB-dependent receptor [Sandaracinobacteroides saxicola]|uniref:TonB-dependent receptor n=1 Tax=Sandaracinobacteroides saxicola TaxID=2759707 RepID=A0A7G5II69_9SPHN|nr:TonB-dependent receptor [Sandaracinobacteroides saxicola]QMW23061.1 TonB-dependent receptor [Sandaracinobacteroides saxicola]
MQIAPMNIILASVSLLALTGAAQAQTAAKADTGGLEDIIVTAQKRAENIQDVSIAIQAVTAAGLERSGITDVSRIELITPGLTFARYGPDAKISLRGANSNNTFLDAAPSVGVFVDGVYKPRASQQTRAFFDVSRMEVLKGPQGTLYGRNTLAGAVNLYTNAPSTTGFAAGATVSYARFNTLRTEGFVNAPLSDSFAVRLAGYYERGDGYVKNLNGENLGTIDTVAFRGSARYAPAGGGDLTLRVTNVRERGNVAGLFAYTGVCRNLNAQGLTDPYGTTKDCRNPRRGAAGTRDFNPNDPHTVNKDFVHNDRIDEFNATLEGNYPLADTLDGKIIASYTDFKLDVGQDNDFSEAPIAADFLRERVKSYTLELQLASRDTGRFKYNLGGYASRDKIQFLSASLRYLVTDDFNNAIRPLVTTPDGITVRVLNPTPILVNQINMGDPTVANRNGRNSNTFQYVNVTTLGAFGQASYELIDSLRVVGAIRYSIDKKDSVNFNGPTSYRGPQFPLFAPITVDGFSTDPALATSRTKRDYSNVTWRGAVEFDAGEDVLVFAQVSTGFLSGSLATDGTTTGDQKSINYELGIKSRFMDNRVQFNGSIYHTKYKNLVTSFQRLNASGSVDTIAVNGGDIKTTGVEAALEILPVENFRVTLTANYLDSKFGAYSVLAPHQTVKGLGQPTARFISLRGLRPQFAPEFTASVIGAYDIDLGDMGRLTPQVQFFFSSAYSAQTQVSFLDNNGDQKAFTKTDLRVSWSSANDRFGIDAYVENIENSIVNQRTVYGGDGINQTTWSLPTNYGVRLRAKF